MYTNESKLDELILRAERVVLSQDRAKFAPIFAVVERFCAEHITKCALWSVPAVTLPKRDFGPGRLDSYSLVVIVNDQLFDFSNELLSRVKADESVDEHLRKYSMMQTVVRHVEIEFKVLGRVLVQMHRAGVAYGRQPQMDYIACMKPLTVSGPFTGVALHAVPPELLLIDLYRKMYSLADFGDIAQHRVAESALFAAMRTKFTGSGRKKDRGKTRTPFNARMIRDAFSAEGKIATMASDVLIGQCAIAVTVGGPIPEHCRLQVLTADVAGFAAKFGRAAGFEVTAAERSSFVWNDFLLRRTELSMMVRDGEKKKVVCDVYNALEYSLVPYAVESGVKVGIPSVILRFLLADAWHLRVISACTSSESLLHRADTMLTAAIAYRATFGDVAIQTTNIAGVHLNEKAEKMAILRDASEYGSSKY